MVTFSATFGAMNASGSAVMSSLLVVDQLLYVSDIRIVRNFRDGLPRSLFFSLYLLPAVSEAVLQSQSRLLQADLADFLNWHGNTCMGSFLRQF